MTTRICYHCGGIFDIWFLSWTKIKKRFYSITHIQVLAIISPPQSCFIGKIVKYLQYGKLSIYACHIYQRKYLWIEFLIMPKWIPHLGPNHNDPHSAQQQAECQLNQILWNISALLLSIFFSFIWFQYLWPFHSPYKVQTICVLSCLVSKKSQSFSDFLTFLPFLQHLMLFEIK